MINGFDKALNLFSKEPDIPFGLPGLLPFAVRVKSTQNCFSYAVFDYDLHQVPQYSSP